MLQKCKALLNYSIDMITAHSVKMLLIIFQQFSSNSLDIGWWGVKLSDSNWNFMATFSTERMSHNHKMKLHISCFSYIFIFKARCMVVNTEQLRDMLISDVLSCITMLFLYKSEYAVCRQVKSNLIYKFTRCRFYSVTL